MKRFIIKPRTEHQIQNAILEYLKYHGIMAWRQNAGVIAIPDAKARRGNRIVRLGPTGIPDVIGVIGPRFANKDLLGRMVAVEVKKPGNKPTEAQVYQIRELQAHGAIVAVIHSIEELETWLQTL